MPSVCLFDTLPFFCVISIPHQMSCHVLLTDRRTARHLKYDSVRVGDGYQHPTAVVNGLECSLNSEPDKEEGWGKNVLFTEMPFGRRETNKEGKKTFSYMWNTTEKFLVGGNFRNHMPLLNNNLGWKEEVKFLIWLDFPKK